MATSPASATDDFTDEEIAESLKPFFAEVDADYEKVMPGLVKAFKAKGPPDAEEKSALGWLTKTLATEV